MTDPLEAPRQDKDTTGRTKRLVEVEAPQSLHERIEIWVNEGGAGGEDPPSVTFPKNSRVLGRARK